MHSRQFRIAANYALFNHLIGPSQQHWGHSKAERLGGFEIDDQIEFRRLHDGRSDGLPEPLRCRILALATTRCGACRARSDVKLGPSL